MSAIGNDLYNSTVNERTSYPVVADPESTDINQAYVNFSGVNDTVIKTGRRELNLDNERFIGAVAWRQNHQTLDGIEIKNSSLEKTDVFYSWNYQVNRIFSDESDVGRFHSQIHLININNHYFEEINLVPFVYLLDLDSESTASSATYGLRATGVLNAKSNRVTFPYSLSYAHQTDYAGADELSADYYQIEPSIKYNQFLLKLGYESLGSDQGSNAFQTPLATLHAFNGRADKFLTTPTTGLEDLYAELKLTFPNLGKYSQELSLSVTYHDFSSEFGGLNYGSEVDLALMNTLSEKYAFGLVYANYHADELYVDTNKFWALFTAKFST